MKIKRLNELAVIPKFQSAGAAGFDFHSTEKVLVMPGETVMIGTGLAFAIPPGYELQVRPRSGISAKTKARVILGTVDSDYRGEVKIILDNTGHLPYTVEIGDRIAQGVINQVNLFDFEVVDELDATARGAGGFGSSGV